MKPLKLSLSIATVLTMSVACHSTKKSTASPAPSATASAPVAAPAPAPAATVAKPSNGIYTPGPEELAAIQTKYPDATLDQLREGHTLYTVGACVNCHGAKNIYHRSEAEWKDVIDDMAQRARMNPVQKDAVYKYVLAVKAMQGK